MCVLYARGYGCEDETRYNNNIQYYSIDNDNMSNECRSLNTRRRDKKQDYPTSCRNPSTGIHHV